MSIRLVGSRWLASTETPAPIVAPVPRPTGHPVSSARSPLAAARLVLGWTQARAVRVMTDTARAWGWTLPERDSLMRQLRRWESGAGRPAPDYVLLLASVYGRTPAELGIAREDAGAAA
ncbi:helix-turn-helix domain-containing protein [Streptacidiphilus monticola]|uniref:Helix-turn-helix domain-containing protein n=1 Tax=Streptacidiphilus monticola TaxID=2161674 RepID=A0ABW1G2W5_9ACTN